MFSSTKREGLEYVLMYRIQMVTITRKNEYLLEFISTFTLLTDNILIIEKKYTFLFLNVYLKF